MDQNLQNLVEIAKEAATSAGEEILSVYNSDHFNIEVKDDHSPLTQADKAAHKRIMEYLEKTGIPVLSEEGKEKSYLDRRDWNLFWLVDPLDGTKEFIKRNGEFTVNIALIMEGEPLLGVVYAPVLDWLYWGGKDQGAFKTENGQTFPINTAKSQLSDPGLKVVASRSHLNQETRDFLDTLINPEIVSMGSSLKFMLVAEGKAHVYPRYAPTMEWDTGAAHAVVEAAGGRVFKEPGRKKMVYNKEDLLNPHFLVIG